jgi:hypothetical protein
VTGKGHGLPNRYGIGAVEKWGKTSFGAQFPGAVFIESKGETGLETLIDAGRLPETPHFPECMEWLSLLGCVDTLLEEQHDYKTVVIDTLNGAESLCHDHTRETDCGNDKEKFAAYGRGTELALGYWRELLAKLDRLRVEKKMRVVCLYHMKVKLFKNPLGADYDRYEPEMDQKTWGITKKWLDVIMFGNFETAVTNVQENKRSGEVKGKSLGGQMRILYTERTAAYDAGNRIGLPPEIEMGDSAAQAWANFTEAIKAGRANQ